MTWRSIILGLAGALFLGVATFFNDQVLRGTYLIGNFLPISVFGLLLLFTLLVNPLLARVRRSAALSATELAAAFAIMLSAGYVGGRGLLHYFATAQMMPHHFVRTTPAWQGEPAWVATADVRDWAALAEALRRAEERPDGHILRVVAGSLPADVRGDLPAAGTEPQVQVRLLEALNRALEDPDLAAAPPPAAELPVYVRQLLDRPVHTPEQTHTLHRGLLDHALPEAIRPRQPGVLERAPPRLLADPAADPTQALDGFLVGLGTDEDPIGMRGIPWFAWRRSLGFWVPLILTMVAWVIAFAVVLHRQWADHEHLPYPTAEFARALLPEKGRALGAIFRERIFWIGFLAVLAIHLYNYADRVWPQTLVPFARQLDLRPIMEIFPVFQRGGGWMLFHPVLYFTIVGFAFFLSSDVSLSMGLSPYLYVLAAGTAAGYGLSFGGGMMQTHIDASLYIGGYMGIFLVILYSGRRWLRASFARGLGLRIRDEVPAHVVWSTRVFLVAFLLFVWQLTRLDLAAPLALMYALGMLMVFVVISRLLAEGGVIFVRGPVFPCAIIWTLLGTTAIGPDQLLILGVLSSILMVDTREALLPFVASGLRVAERAGAPLGRVGRWCFVGVALALAAGIPASLLWQYRLGAAQAVDGWARNTVPSAAFDVGSRTVRTLQAQGALDLAESVEGLARLAHVSIQPSLLIAFLVTFGLVLLFTFLRHRFARFPLHPLLFVTLGTWQIRNFAFSFLVGWLIKGAVTRYGGARLYRRLKPLMVGLVAGEVFAGLLLVMIGAAVYFITGERPVAYRIMPT